MAREIPYIAAVQEAIRVEMERDPTVVFYGQDVAPSDEDPLVQAFGRERVRVSPISETAEIGMAVGLALAGYRPVVELLMAEFMLVAMNQVVNEAPRLRYMSGGQVKVPACSRPATDSPRAGPASTPARSTGCSWASPG